VLSELVYNVEVEDGKVTKLLGRNGEPLTAAELARLGFNADETEFGCVEEHPECADRGGYRPTVLGCGLDDGGWGY
jgi:hypothetical protein